MKRVKEVLLIAVLCVLWVIIFFLVLIGLIKEPPQIMDL